MLAALTGCSESAETDTGPTEQQNSTDPTGGRFVPDSPGYVVLTSDAMPPVMTMAQSGKAAATPIETLQRTRELTDRGSDQRDPRWFGYAETILGKLLEVKPDYVPALLQLADLLQKQHRFDASEALYRRILTLDPQQAQPYLSLAMLRRQLGDFDGMAKECRRLAQLTHPAIVAICLSAAEGLTGRLPAAYQRLTAVLQQPLIPGIDVWIRVEAAEMAARLALPQDAEQLWSEALAMASAEGGLPAAELLAAVADFYISIGSYDKAAELLEGDSSPGLVLRQAAAEIALDDTGKARANWQARLEPWLKTWLDRGERTHDAELALYYHEVAADQKAALRPALQQWRDRKEPQDLLLLLEILAATSADEPDRTATVAEITAWINSSGYQDARASELLERMK